MIVWKNVKLCVQVSFSFVIGHQRERATCLYIEIGIMKLGQFICLGSLQRLKNRFSHGYAVQVKVPITTMDRFIHELTHTLPGIEIEGRDFYRLIANISV